MREEIEIRRGYAFLLTFLISILIAAASAMTLIFLSQLEDMEDTITRLEQSIEILEIERDYALFLLEGKTTGYNIYKERFEYLDSLFEEIFTVRATAYAPLDVRAVAGMCYSGDPRITASGATSQPGVSIAADPSIPFGTTVLVEGFGERIVHDRGGRILGDRIDIMMPSRASALRINEDLRILIIE